MLFCMTWSNTFIENTKHTTETSQKELEAVLDICVTKHSYFIDPFALITEWS